MNNTVWFNKNVVVTTEDAQASVYGDLVGQSLCDPDIAEVNFFGFFDDRLRTGFQAALNRVDGTPRPASEVVRSAIVAGACVGTPVAWQPASEVVGTTKPERWKQNADLLRAGPLAAELEAKIRARWKEVAKAEWIGQT